MDRISSRDDDYISGDLSLYPETLDTKSSLYEVKNNAETYLTQSLAYNGKMLVVDDTSKFPSEGLLRVGVPPGQIGDSEIIYYGLKTSNSFQNLKRGFAGSRQNTWAMNSPVSNAVLAETHNATKDAILKIQKKLGTKTNPESLSLNGLLTELENKYLSPRALFRAFPTIGSPPLTVRFQNFIVGQPIRILWDFGDGTTSVESNPEHIYATEGSYTVTLNVLTNTGGQGVTIKNNYITVDETSKIPFFYVTPSQGSVSTEFEFVDQTTGDIVQRYWLFDDGTTERVDDPNVHTIKHSYASPGVYKPSLLIVFANQTQRRAFLVNDITVV